jgi:hypothetical protein
MRSLKAFVERRPVVAYFVLAFLLSWSVSALLIAKNAGLINVSWAIDYLAAFGPAFSAVIVTGLTEGQRA